MGHLPVASPWISGELGWSSDTSADVLRGGDGNDRLVGGAGVDSLDGGGGTDLAVYLGHISEFRFSVEQYGSARSVVLKTASGLPVDGLQGVELLQIGALFYAFDDLSARSPG